jgi:hypothetical protein
MPPKTERFEMRWESDMLTAIDRWRKKMGMPRAEAIRTLIKIGLVARDVSLFDIAGALGKTPDKLSGVSGKEITLHPAKPKKRIEKYGKKS